MFSFKYAIEATKHKGKPIQRPGHNELESSVVPLFCTLQNVHLWIAATSPILKMKGYGLSPHPSCLAPMIAMYFPGG